MWIEKRRYKTKVTVKSEATFCVSLEVKKSEEEPI